MIKICHIDFEIKIVMIKIYIKEEKMRNKKSLN